MGTDFHIEVSYAQRYYHDQRICGDVFLSERLKDENRVIAVLSDGMGHGVKANVLGTLTAKMAMNFTKEHRDPARIAEIIIKTLPICSERKIAYSTFAVIDIESDGKVNIIEYENPQCIITRGGKVYEPEWQCMILDTPDKTKRELLYCSFYAQKEDRITLFSDGIEQSGMGSEKNPFGWPREKIIEYILGLINQTPDVSGQNIANKLVNRANMHDNYSPLDDTTCASIYFREPRKMLLCTGPPYEMERDVDYGNIVKTFNGIKVLCGGTTADIMAKVLNRKVVDVFEFEDPELPPISKMDGINLITEGILTLSKVNRMLEEYSKKTSLGRGPADLIVKYFLESDEIRFVIGTRINTAHQDPNLPMELEIRRTVIKRIARLLENKFLKQVTLEYI